MRIPKQQGSFVAVAAVAVLAEIANRHKVRAAKEKLGRVRFDLREVQAQDAPSVARRTKHVTALKEHLCYLATKDRAGELRGVFARVDGDGVRGQVAAWALEAAAKTRAPKCLAMLLGEFEFAAHEISAATRAVIRFGDASMLQVLLDRPGTNRNDLLQKASREGRADFVARILDEPGVNPNVNGKYPLRAALVNEHHNVARVLRARGATEPTERDYDLSDKMTQGFRKMSKDIQNTYAKEMQNPANWFRRE